MIRVIIEKASALLREPMLYFFFEGEN